MDEAAADTTQTDEREVANDTFFSLDNHSLGYNETTWNKNAI